MENVTRRIQLALQTLKRTIESESTYKTSIGVTQPQMFLLYFLSREEKCKLSQLAEKLEVKPSAITVMIDRLEKPGYVRRIQDTEDRRAIWVEITEAGQAILKQAIQERNEILGKYLSRLSQEEIVQLAGMLEKMMGIEGNDLL